MAPTDHSVEQLRKLLSVYRDQQMETARALPAEFYRSKSFFDFECEAMLRREWLCVGRADQIPDCGDYFTTELLGEPLLFVRGDDGRIRTLVNICRHRGMLVANGAGHARNFMCPYHSWTYDRAGKLLRAPRMEKSGHFDADRCHLPELATEVWNGFVFVNSDGNATPLGPRLKELEGLLANYEGNRMHHTLVEDAVWHANWKCVVENFLEGYHLSVLHKETLHPITPTSLCERFPAGSAYAGYKAYYSDSVPPPSACSPKLTERERRCSTLFCVFPSLLVSQAPERLRYYVLQPVSVDSVRVQRGTGNYEADLPADEATRRIAVWNRIVAEDHNLLERLQRGFSSRHTSSGPLAPADYEGTLLDFYRYLAVRLGTEAELRVA
jgi:phenylpropionate dioxygenase-like ring-hydroxylating dioxygenase large terminal subunit